MRGAGDEMKRYLAIDIGASSGRHIAGCVENGKIVLEEVYRFENGQVRRNGHDCWDIERLVASVKAGIDAAMAKYAIESIGIDTWGVDFVHCPRSPDSSRERRALTTRRSSATRSPSPTCIRAAAYRRRASTPSTSCGP